MQYKDRMYASGGILCVISILYVPATHAAVETFVGAGIEYTDNARLVSDNEEDDWILRATAGVGFEQSSGTATIDLDSSVTYSTYTNDTFGDQTDFDLGANANWEMLRDRLSWQISDYYRQRTVNAIDAYTPDNKQDTNSFAIGPDITFRIGDRQRLSLIPRYKNFYYESDADNEQYEMTANWLYQARQEMELGLQGDVNKVKYNDDDENPEFTVSSIAVLVTGSARRSSYNLALGKTYVDRDRFEDQDGFKGSLRWNFNLSGHSAITAYIASELTDAGTSALASERDPARGDIDNVQVAGDIFRDDIIRLGYTRTGSLVASRIWGELRQLDYEETLNDREVATVAATLEYGLSPLVTTRLSGGYEWVKETDVDRRDKTYYVGGELGYDLRKVRASAGIRYENKGSNVDTSEYDEFRAELSLIYYPGLPASSR